ncbi:uncharacterized protein LOC111261079 [Varroa jacobsoni]|uniref:uncharacterized protein LOC111261079 n=1 Tax=Varroa jacobsoni TaxID=62625 RepID=UPI000BF91CD0|nr:uncharacterized protein LOC111261079 [Varroa jacobsoni]
MHLEVWQESLWRDVWMLFANGSWRYAVTNINERSPNRVRFRLSVLVPYGLIPSRMNSMRSPQNGLSIPRLEKFILGLSHIGFTRVSVQAAVTSYRCMEKDRTETTKDLHVRGS